MTRRAEITRWHIVELLAELARPMTSAEISELLWVKFYMRVNTASVGVNLGYIRAAGIVDRRTLPKWGKPYWFGGHWNLSTENWWWHKGVVSKADAHKFLNRIRAEVETKLTLHQRQRGKPVTRPLKPHTDDMRQMIEDLRRA